MTVSKEITRLEHSSVKLTVTIGKDDVRSEYDGLLSEYTKQAQIPGFRKGKVPRDVLVRKFGEALKGEALGRIVEKAVGEIFEDESFPKEDKPLPYSTPALDDEANLKLNIDEDFTFAVVYDVLPQVKVEKYTGLEAEVPDCEVEDEDINRELDAIRERNAIVQDKDEGAEAAKDDVVTVNYCELGESGEVLANSERQDFVFTIGTGYNIYHFDDDIIGMKKGETKEITKTFPEDYDDKLLAGKTKKIRVTLTALKLKNLPELDDDLAQDVDEKYKTLDDLKKSIRSRMEKDLESRLRSLKINALLEKMMEATPVDVPESMIRVELDGRWRNMARRFGTDSDGLLRIMGGNRQGAQAMLDDWRPDAVKALHSRLIVETLMDDLKLEASDEEADKEMERQAAASETTLDEIKKYYEQEGMRDYLKEDIREQKLFDKLLAENTIKTGEKKKYLDLMQING